MPGGVDLAVHGHGRASVSSSVSNVSDLLGDSESARHARQGSYLEGNMKLLATM